MVSVNPDESLPFALLERFYLVVAVELLRAIRADSERLAQKHRGVLRQKLSNNLNFCT
jgi:hypothetical protein